MLEGWTYHGGRIWSRGNWQIVGEDPPNVAGARVLYTLWRDRVKMAESYHLPRLGEMAKED